MLRKIQLRKHFFNININKKMFSNNSWAAQNVGPGQYPDFPLPL